MTGIPPWIPVAPAQNKAAILGQLPMQPGTVSFAIPTAVVPPNATGILVFAWCALTGANPGGGYWHMTVNVPGGLQNWFSLMGLGSALGDDTTVFNSQAFWLPVPVDSSLSVTFTGKALPNRSNRGEVEIHGYMPGASAAHL
jgi:hypothetical protein